MRYLLNSPFLQRLHFLKIHCYISKGTKAPAAPSAKSGVAGGLTPTQPPRLTSSRRELDERVFLPVLSGHSSPENLLLKVRTTFHSVLLTLAAPPPANMDAFPPAKWDEI